MRQAIGKLTRVRAATPAARAPDGMTVYAIGDIHGRVDLLDRLLDKVSADLEAAPPAAGAVLVFLGDYVDRGPDARLVLETLKQLKHAGGGNVLTLKGNHEEAFLGFLADAGSGAAWAEHGGRETLLSYGVTLPKHRTDSDAWETARRSFIAAVPPDHVQFLQSLSLWEALGDYVFVHAGVRPGVPMMDQEERDLLWIREEFLQSNRAMDQVVVHGHTPVEQPSVAEGRIGIDTGAYATGILTALRLQGEERLFLNTGA